MTTELPCTRLPQLRVVSAIVESIAGKARQPVEVVGPWGVAKSLIAAQAAALLGRPLLVVCGGRIESEDIFEDLCTFVGAERTALLPAWEVLPTDAMLPADDIVAERMNTLQKLAGSAAKNEFMCTVAPARALVQGVVDPARLTRQTVSLSVGEEHDLEDLATALVAMGYAREIMVERRGDLSVRGCIFDVFPISAELPYRIEFFGDEVESIRRFEPETQRSVDTTDSVTILPRSEKALLFEEKASAGRLASVTDYLPEDTVVVIDEPLAVVEEARESADQAQGNSFVLTWGDVAERLNAFTQITLAQVGGAKAEGATRLTCPTRSVTAWTGNLGGFWDQLKEWDLADYSVVLYCNNTGERQRLAELLEEQGYRLDRDRFDLRLELGRIRKGFSSAKDRLAVLSEREVFGRHYVRRDRRRFEAGEAITTFGDLKAGDYIVHLHHGIGRYEGLKRFSGKPGDFLAIKYVRGDTLYVPVTHIDLVQKYIAGDGASPKIDRLGGATWARTKARVKRAVREMTEDLIKLYAAREAQDGYAFAPDTPWQYEFEDAFEYEETADQVRAIAEVKADMESAKPMERLLCGDVGFGKTEVALRAAFKAVLDGRQVALLVPTTVLAQQHYTTFSERLADYPVNVAMLSRFATPREQKATVQGLKSGDVDIVIGTHRLISKDVQFKDLGLVILDEEHRFGVAQKEKLKQLRTNVDVLTMTATPIPRTLQFSLMGARDMSLINTAPNDRLPIHTCIEAFDEDVVREAIAREVAREGQVFYLHNRVRTIYSVGNIVQELAPNARVAVGHGQMPEHELEKVMAAFVRREIDVLVCTTIIGSGLDIPNANTIIIDHADQFGLAELYQLRGRVGRYKHRAFAYLLFPGDHALSEEAQHRLKALEEFSSLGEGFRLAMRDLEIRGAGNLLGVRQHGHIVAVGYDTYMQLIRDAVAEVKGKTVKPRILPGFEVAVEAYIPQDYVPAEAQKITLYKRVSAILSLEDAQEMIEELTDRFGKPPAPVRRLVEVMRVRALAGDVGAKLITAAKDALVVEFDAGAPVLSRNARSALAEEFGNRVQFGPENQPAVSFALRAGEDVLENATRLLEAIGDL